MRRFRHAMLFAYAIAAAARLRRPLDAAAILRH